MLGFGLDGLSNLVLDVEFLTKNRYPFKHWRPSRNQDTEFANNFLSRSIPKSFSNLKNVESLDLSYNKLSGEIPSQLMELYSLGTFNVSYNNLYGPIPNNWQFGTFDGSAYAGNPCLCGPIINKSCTNASILPSLPSSREEGEVELVAFYWSFGGSYCVVILGLLVGLPFDQSTLAYVPDSSSPAVPIFHTDHRDSIHSSSVSHRELLSRADSIHCPVIVSYSIHTVSYVRRSPAPSTPADSTLQSSSHAIVPP
ncbi:hypothetical protein Patl1_02650 [Pistacia atlantica]|uniref:Uncharacterized protein n=1 Tax=Pistacia atlantica TaxID=434234 RepID=A0ACC1C602_9ROSI|nr:hypothetical protein Patl1_02650 [Pistacia atlantica]